MALHPLQPLSAGEVAQAVGLLRRLPVFTPSTRIISIILGEPEKSSVYEWQPEAAAIDRQADAVLFDNGLNMEWTPKLRQANKTHFPANGEWSYGSESTEVHAGV